MRTVSYRRVTPGIDRERKNTYEKIKFKAQPI